MKIDAFTFFNEYEMLESRLEYYYDFMDFFVISECDYTHAGNHKGLNFPKEIARYRKYLNKIIYLPMSIDPSLYDFSKPEQTDYSSGNWQLEKQQRNHLMSGLRFFSPECFVMISDVDEICTKESISSTIDNYREDIGVYGSNQEMFWYSFRQREVNIWSGSILTKNKFVFKYSPEFFRERRWNVKKELKGYHLTYFMPLEKIKYKIENFAHQELNKEDYTNIDNIKERISKKIEPFARKNVELISVEKESIDEEIYNIFNKINGVKNV